MAYRLDVDRLVKAELQYELSIRGVTVEDNVATLRKALRKAVKSEAASSILSYISPFSFEDDYKAINNSIENLQTLLENCSFGKRVQAVETKIVHIVGRIKNSQPGNDCQIKSREELLSTMDEVIENYEMELKRFSGPSEESMTSMLEIGSLRIGSPEVPIIESSGLPAATPAVVTVSPISKVSIPVSLGKPIPLVKWGISFTGDKSQSVNSFLERVGELRVARNVSEVQLLREAFDLFKEKALVWFRANRDDFSSWKELETALREEYLPPDYDEVLLKEIERRTQGHNESLGIYVAVMKNMFSRLNEKLSEVRQLKIMRRNLTPFFQTHLGLTDITTVRELIRYGKIVEEKRVNIENYVPPSRKKSDIEPDLAFLDTRSNLATIESVPYPSHSYTPRSRDVGRNKVSVCWNCQSPRHLARECTVPQTRNYCYLCGEPNFTSRSCPKCTSGNGPRGQ